MASKKQIKVTADQLGRALHNLDELCLDYVVIIDGIPAIHSNVRPLHAAAIIEQAYLLNNKISELRIEQSADKITAIPTSEGDEPMAH